MSRTIWQEFDVNDFLYHLESIRFYEDEMVEEKDSRFGIKAKELRDRHIRSLKKKLLFLKGTDFTAALDLVKEMFPGRQYELTGFYNF